MKSPTLPALACLLALAAVWFLPSSGSNLPDILLRSGLYALLFAFLVLHFRISAGNAASDPRT
ncbi:MAG: hypothetical protein OSW77_10785 [Proteobacteria bacterium]|nr:hypothetical protein [Pseudomonadota bacterium]